MAYKTKLRKVGGSVMLAIPPALLDTLELEADSQVGLAVKNGRLIVEPKARISYTMDQLLAQCDPKTRKSAEDREWLSGPRKGRELI